jgi:uncharacterized membrane protein YqhA
MVEERQEGRLRSGGPWGGHWVFRVVASIRFFVVFAVLGTFLSAAALYIYGTLVVVERLWETVTRDDVSVDGAKHLQVTFVELTDVYLLGTVLVVVAIGLSQLFLQAQMPLPAWLRVRNLAQLSAKLIEVVGVLLGVTFLGYVVEAGGEADIMGVGIGFAVVIAALSVLLVVVHRFGTGDDPPRAD